MTPSAAAKTAEDLAKVNATLERVARHQSAGRYEAAGALLDSLLVQYPRMPRLLHYKALNLSFSGNRDEAITLLREVVEGDDHDPVALVDLGTILAQGGDMDGAIDCLRRATEIAPKLALAHGNLGAALLVKTQTHEAIKHLEQAVTLDGSVLDVHTNLAQAHIRNHNFAAATDGLFRALALDPHSALTHSLLALALFRLERPDSAEHHARRAIELAPNEAEPRLHLGNILAARGRIDEAVETLLGIAGSKTHAIQALSRITHIRKTTADSPEYAALTHLAEKLDRMPEDPRSHVAFALGKAEADLGNFARSMEMLHVGNAATRALHPHDAERAEAMVRRLLDFVTPELLARCASQSLTDVSPIFITGLPRSGTTLMDQMFSRHPLVRAGGELSASTRAFARNRRIQAGLEGSLDSAALTDDDFARLGEDYIAVLHAEGLRNRHVSDKMPANYLYIPLLAMALPKAKFLVMRRHPMDVLLSNYTQDFGRNQTFSTAFDSLGATWRNFDRLVNRWAALLPERVMQVSYEAVVADPESQMREIADFVGLPFDASMLDHTASSHQVNTASVAQVRQPIYGSSVARWKRYGPLLKDLAREVESALDQEDRRAAGLDA